MMESIRSLLAKAICCTAVSPMLSVIFTASQSVYLILMPLFYNAISVGFTKVKGGQRAYFVLTVLDWKKCFSSDVKSFPVSKVQSCPSLQYLSNVSLR